MSEQCCEKTLGGGYWPKPCSKPAKLHTDGKAYCATHNPDNIAKRRAKSNAEWKAKSERWTENNRLQKRRNSQADMFDELLAALVELRAWCGPGTAESLGAKCDTWGEADTMVDEVINKAKAI